MNGEVERHAALEEAYPWLNDWSGNAERAKYNI